MRKAVWGILIILVVCTGMAAADERTTIDPIADVLIGDNVTVSGTTDASYVSVSVIFLPEYPMGRITERIFVADDGLMHNWSVELNGSLFDPGEYIVTANTRGIAYPEPNRSTTLAVVMETKHQWIAIDPIPEQSAGTVLEITGTTGLTPHHQIFFEMLPADRFPMMREETVPLYSMRTFVYPVKGTDEYNYWNVSVDTASFPPGKYLVRLAAFGQNEREGIMLSILTSAITPEWEIYAGNDPGKLRITAMQEVVLTGPAIPGTPGFGCVAAGTGIAAAALFFRRR